MADSRIRDSTKYRPVTARRNKAAVGLPGGKWLDIAAKGKGGITLIRAPADGWRWKVPAVGPRARQGLDGAAGIARLTNEAAPRHEVLRSCRRFRPTGPSHSLRIYQAKRSPHVAEVRVRQQDMMCRPITAR